MEQQVTSILDREKIKYNKNKLKDVVNYCMEEYDGIKKGNNSMIDHVIGVADEVSKLKIDDTSVYAALLHGVLKCNNYDRKKFKERFGEELVNIIETVDKLSCLNYKTSRKIDSQNLRNMFLAIAKDVRTVIIKLADRLYNMRNIRYIDNEEVKKNMAKECLEIYAPIAHRIGMSQIKSELEDISFKVLLPDEYSRIKIDIDEKKKEREEYIENRIKEINEELSNQNIVATVYGRPKHFYSIYKKMKEKSYSIDDLYDLLAIRIIVSSVKDCYSVLGIVHDMYKPMPGRFKDYIAVPKTNMYQSLHTTVFGDGKRPFEIQIRTWDMHKVAENGIAAHFAYKEKSSKISDVDKKIVWLRQTLQMQKDIEGINENVEKLKGEIFGEEVYVFTPKGDIKSFPKGSTTVDFAYSIHQKVAETMVGAKINAKLVPINTKLENTDIVEIITSPSAAGPSRDWLKYVKTTSSKNKITSFLKKQGRDVNIAKGKEIFEKYLNKQKIAREMLLEEKYLNKMLSKSGFNSLDECYENIGFGSISIIKIMNRLAEGYKQLNNTNEKSNNIVNNIRKKTDNSNMVVVSNLENCKVKFARCCSPIPGDDIVGYITYSNGVTVHRTDCNSLKDYKIKGRIIDVKWKSKITTDFSTRVKIRANNRDNIIGDILKVAKDLKSEVLSLNSKITTDMEIIIDLTVVIKDTIMLQKLIRGIKKVDSVFDVKRLH